MNFGWTCYIDLCKTKERSMRRVFNLHATKATVAPLFYGRRFQGQKASEDEVQVQKAKPVALADSELELDITPRMDGSPMANVEYDSTVPYTREDHLIELVEKKHRDKVAKANSTVQSPAHPVAAGMIPQYQRVKKHAKLLRYDELNPDITRKEHHVALPKPEQHPWVEGQPIGPHIVHGDGQQNIVGTNEVGFSNDRLWREWPKEWRGFQRITPIGHKIPEKHGEVNQNMVIKHSLQLTGRGVFASKDIKEGETIMIVKSKTVNLGYNAEIDRLCEMTAKVILDARNGTDEDKEFFHRWILTGQMSNIVERWPSEGTKKVLEEIGGEEVLAEV